MFSDLKKIDQEAQIEAKKKASHSPIVPTKKAKNTEQPVSVVISEKKVEIVKSPAKVKEIRMTLPLPTDTLAFLDQMERDIFVRRSTKSRSKQRLTKNSIARAWIALLKQFPININDVQDEDDLFNRLKKAVVQDMNL